MLLNTLLPKVIRPKKHYFIVLCGGDTSQHKNCWSMEYIAENADLGTNTLNKSFL